MDNVLELRQLWQIIRKYFFALFLIAIIGTVFRYNIAKFLDSPTYSSSTSMLVNRSAENTSKMPRIDYLVTREVINNIR
ncbi:hypothetical protein H3N00_11645 (plasmid) [Weissella cibaria]|nr:Wzz/FepE/Etk N-terminal domain-containing protein [Weissella cibaria]QMU89616.1 hypothetical protein H3N00_11645 [Weissella cibaria]